MPINFHERFIAYLALISGLLISVVAEYYSIVGFTAIFSAAVIPVIIMGIVLGLGKITATVWLKQNWNIAPWSLRIYLLSAIAVLMLVTSLGIFGFLSKAHSDQSLVSGDALAKLAIYDEKIKTEKENIDVARKALKQLDEAVDQVMGRSTDERGADKASQIRRAQQRERAALQRDIVNAQNNISKLNEERAPIAAEVRQVEAEVGPIKYIAAFVYGETDKTILEKAVTWVIIILIIVFDPLAVILLLASQISFQNFRDRDNWNFERHLEEAADALNDVFADELNSTDKTPEEIMGIKPDPWVADVGEKPTKEELAEIAEGDSPSGRNVDIVNSMTTVTTSTQTIEPAPHHPDTHPYLNQGFQYPAGWMFVSPLVAKKEESTEGDSPEKESDVVSTATVTDEPLFIQNEEQKESDRWSKTVENISQEEYLNISQEKLEEKINLYAGMLRNKQIRPEEIPVALLAAVKSRV